MMRIGGRITRGVVKKLNLVVNGGVPSDVKLLMQQKQIRRLMGILLVILMGVGGAGARPVDPPTEELVAKLIGEEAEVLPNSINVAVIIDGEAKLEGNFLTGEAVHVEFVWSVVEDGRRVRRVAHRTFFWNEKYGWFIFRKVSPRGGDAIDICSEKLGLLRLR